MPGKFWAVFLLLASTTDARKGPQGAPRNSSAHAYIVRVRTGSYVGRCVGYCDHETTIEAGFLRTFNRSWSDKQKYPNVKVERRIRKQDWEDLQHPSNATVLAGFTGRIGCPGCADEPMERAEMEFSNGTKKSVFYNVGNGPPSVRALRTKIQTLAPKAE